MNPANIFSDARGRPWLANLDPRLKIAAIIWFSSLAVLFESTIALTGTFVLSILLASGLSMRPRGWLAVITLLALVAWSTVISQALFFEPLPGAAAFRLVEPRHIGFWKFAGLQLSAQGALYGLTQSLRMLAVTLAGLAVCLSTSPERLLSAMAHLRVSVSISFLTVTTLRFLPLLAMQWSTIRQARRLRGYRLSLWHLATPSAGRVIAAELMLLTPLLASTVRRAAALATSVASRGFDPTARRTFYPQLRMRPIERASMVILAVSLVALVIIKSIYWAHVGGWHPSPSLQPLHDFTSRWL